MSKCVLKGILDDPKQIKPFLNTKYVYINIIGEFESSKPYIITDMLAKSDSKKAYFSLSQGYLLMKSLPKIYIKNMIQILNFQNSADKDNYRIYYGNVKQNSMFGQTGDYRIFKNQITTYLEYLISPDCKTW